MVWINKLRSRLALEIGYVETLGSDRAEFFEEITGENAGHIRAAALMTVGLCAVGLAIHPSQTVLYLVGAVIGLVGAAARPVRWRRVSVGIFLFWCSVACAYLDATDSLSYPSVVNLLGLWTVSAALVTFRPLTALLYFGMGALGASCLVWWEGAGTLVWERSYLPILAAALLGYLVSRMVFGLKLKSFLARKRAEELAREVDANHRLNQLLTFAVQQGLTPREQEILGPLLDGATNQTIADSLYISLDTVKKHVYHIFQKAGVESRMQLARRVEAVPTPRKNPTNA